MNVMGLIRRMLSKIVSIITTFQKLYSPKIAGYAENV